MNPYGIPDEYLAQYGGAPAQAGAPVTSAPQGIPGLDPALLQAQVGAQPADAPIQSIPGLDPSIIPPQAGLDTSGLQAQTLIATPASQGMPNLFNVGGGQSSQLKPMSLSDVPIAPPQTSSSAKEPDKKEAAKSSLEWLKKERKNQDAVVADQKKAALEEAKKEALVFANNPDAADMKGGDAQRVQESQGYNMGLREDRYNWLLNTRIPGAGAPPVGKAPATGGGPAAGLSMAQIEEQANAAGPTGADRAKYWVAQGDAGDSEKAYEESLAGVPEMQKQMVAMSAAMIGERQAEREAERQAWAETEKRLLADYEQKNRAVDNISYKVDGWAAAGAAMTVAMAGLSDIFYALGGQHTNNAANMAKSINDYVAKDVENFRQMKDKKKAENRSIYGLLREQGLTDAQAKEKARERVVDETMKMLDQRLAAATTDREAKFIQYTKDKLAADDAKGEIQKKEEMAAGIKANLLAARMRGFGVGGKPSKLEYKFGADPLDADRMKADEDTIEVNGRRYIAPEKASDDLRKKMTAINQTQGIIRRIQSLIGTDKSGFMERVKNNRSQMKALTAVLLQSGKDVFPQASLGALDKGVQTLMSDAIGDPNALWQEQQLALKEFDNMMLGAKMGLIGGLTPARPIATYSDKGVKETRWVRDSEAAANRSTRMPDVSPVGQE